MANLPSAASSLVNNSEVSFQTTSDTHTMVNILNITLSRPESREPTTDGGVQYFYGPPDDSIDYEILGSRSEIQRWIDDTLLTDGLALSRNYLIKYTDEGGTTATLSVSATAAPSFSINRAVEGGLKFVGKLRITTALTTGSVS